MGLEPISHPGFEARYVNVDGIRTHVLEGGMGKRPLILMHGGGAGADGWGNWHSCLDAYARDYRVIVPDMPGFGRTDKPDPALYAYTQANRTRHLIALLNMLELGPADLIGNSMGGATVLGVAIEQPALVRKLVLMGSAGLGIANPDPAAMKDLVGYDYSIEGMRRIIKALTGSKYAVDEMLVKYRHRIMQDDSARKALKVIVSSKLTYEREAIAAVKTPTLIVGGKEDKVAVLARTYGYLELLENSWGFVLPHAGHWVMIESPAEFVAVTKLFLSSEMFSV